MKNLSFAIILNKGRLTTIIQLLLYSIIIVNNKYFCIIIINYYYILVASWYTWEFEKNDKTKKVTDCSIVKSRHMYSHRTSFESFPTWMRPCSSSSALFECVEWGGIAPSASPECIQTISAWPLIRQSNGSRHI